MKRNDLFGHPSALYVLFLTEMWERFSYYGMRALLILYLTKHFLFSDGEAGLIYGSYVALIYGLPLLGGILADRYLGMRKAVTFGAILLVFGHLSMAVEGPMAFYEGGEINRSQFGIQFLYLSLSFIAVGVGFLKANISTLVGTLYDREDCRRDSGFTIFYMGINIGAFAATLLCAYLGETYGWRYGFGVAGVGMVIGLLTFYLGTPLLGKIGLPPNPELLLRKSFIGLNFEKCIYLFSILFLIFVWVLMQMAQSLGIILIILGIASVGWIIWFCLRECRKAERDNIYSMLLLMAFSVLFWALFEQAASSITLFTDRNVNIGKDISAGMFQALNPMFIILSAPLFAFFWTFMGKRKIEPSTPVKFALAILQIGAGFYILVIGSAYADSEGKVALIFLVMMYFLHTTGELCLSPVGLSMVTKLSVGKIMGMMMGVWFLSSSFAGYVSGWIAGLMAINVTGSETVSGIASLQIYSGVFEKLAFVSLTAGVFLLILSPTIRKKMTSVS
ncbi:MAG: MFS transporter [Betaproteobacteria bacterium TMED82]|nr:MAG: MFS transporter [Betaproteobacteria bacterium TMED82]|tara:strand:- start:90069 stop:91583 length:1515 start_codon:yes stop_codon:yes gene_type:complete